MPGRLEGKVALISGAARGMGRSHAVRLAEEGADIVAFDIGEQVQGVLYELATPDNMRETAELVEAQGRRIVAGAADVRDRAAIEAVVSQGLDAFSHIDIVVANAGIAFHEIDVPLWDISQLRWDAIIGVNLTGVWHTVSAAVPSMIEHGTGGSIVIISSTAGLRGFVGAGDYTASKHGVVGLMRTFAQELATHSIRVNTVHPTGVVTGMTSNDSFAAFVDANADMAENLANLLPVGLIEPRDVSNAVLWLASDEARYVTGAMIPVDAGMLTK